MKLYPNIWRYDDVNEKGSYEWKRPGTVLILRKILGAGPLLLGARRCSKHRRGLVFDCVTASSTRSKYQLRQKEIIGSLPCSDLLSPVFSIF